MGLAAKLYREDDRAAERLFVELDATLRDHEFQPIDAEVNDLSISGFRARCAAELPEGAEISLGLAGLGVQRARIVRRDGDFYGCEFLIPLQTADIESALRAETVVDGGFVRMPAPDARAEPEAPYVSPVSFVARAGIIIGLSCVLWGAIGLGIYALVA